MRTFFPVWLSAVLLSALFSLPVSAEWYESKGWAPIINNNVDQARARAVESALRQSLDFAGGSVHSVEEVVDGVLTGQRMQWQTQGAIEHAELVRERVNGQRIEVTLRANIRQNQDQCAAANFRKGLVVVPFELKQSEQARYGDVWELGNASSQRFSRLIGQHSRQFTLEHSGGRKIGFADMLQQNTPQQLGQFARRVALENDSQYVIAGVFDDISTEPRSNTNWTFWSQPKENRNLGLTLYLFDGASGELITRAGIQEHQHWDFDYNEKVDVHSQRFWRSEYGVVLAQRLQDIVHGFDDKLRCQPLKGRVVDVSNENIHINLGSRNGIESGQELSLYHRGNFFDSQGNYREQWVVSPYQLEVTTVELRSAITRVKGEETGTNIQQHDRVVIR